MDDRGIVALYLRRDETAIWQTAEKYGRRLRAEDYRRLLPLLCYSKFVPLFGEKIKFNNQQ